MHLPVRLGSEHTDTHSALVDGGGRAACLRVDAVRTVDVEGAVVTVEVLARG